MLLTKSITEQREVQIEIKTPSFYKTTSPTRVHAICEDGTVIYAGTDIVIKYAHEESCYYKNALESALNGTEITETEFLEFYEHTMSRFDMPLFERNSTSHA